MAMAMAMLPLLLCFFFSCFSLLPALPAVLPDPDPAPVQLLPAAAPATTIPAFPEQSEASAACPLDLSADLLRAVSRACSPAHSSALPSRARCCPSLSAWMLSAYSATALTAATAHHLPSSAYDLPVLPNDSEACADVVESALRTRGAELPRVNGTCDVVYCYCGVRLRRLSCAGGAFEASGPDGRWAATGETARRLERDCARAGLAGCSRCLASLNQLKLSGNATSDARKESTAHDNECQLMGLTWLLSRNRTRYLPAATAVLRAFMAAPDGTPPSCSLSGDEMPLAVDSAQLDGYSASSAIALPQFLLLLIVVLVIFLVS